MTTYIYDGVRKKMVEVTKPLRQRDELKSQHWKNADRHFTSVQMPPWYKYHEMAGGTFDKDGNCQFSSMAQVRKTIDIANAHGENLSYGE